MIAEHEIHAARDYRTGFPVVRLRETDPFVGLLPVTKLQVEQWIWEGGMAGGDGGSSTTWMIERMEHVELRQTPNKYPSKVRRLTRVPVSKCTQENLPSILATNLSLWNSPDETRQPDVQYPTPTSEWGRLLRWLGAFVPSYKSADGWARTLKAFDQYRTKDLVGGVLRLNFVWAPVVLHLLNKLLETVSEEETGLPLMNLGVYELVSDRKHLQKVTESQTQNIWRPFVAGESVIWPTLEDIGVNKWRPVLYPNLPVVTIRPWYEEGQVTGLRSNERPNAFGVAPLTSKTRPDEQGLSGLASGKAKGPLKSYYTGRATMSNRCPVCYEEVDPQTFNSDAGLWCFQQKPVQEDGEPEGNGARTTREHRNSRPPRTAGFYQVESVHRDYLTLARKAPKRIRSVCLSGWTQSGKTVGLLSLWGLLTYPQGKSRLPKAFPADWKVDIIKCSLLDFIRGEALINIAKQTEQMWIEGLLPTRTSALKRALRCPALFKITRRKWLIPLPERQLIINFNDFAGELMSRPGELPDNPEYPNLRTTTDVVFLTPAQDIMTADQHLATFAGGLGSVAYKGKTLDLGKINLILAVSQVDKLRLSSDPKEQQLLNILMQEPYVLPSDRRETELREYFATMRQVHHHLYAWLKQNTPDLVTVAERFASVRYCGFTACGFQPIMEETIPGVEACLPFEPQPVRVADPLLWLLHENGMIDL